MTTTLTTRWESLADQALAGEPLRREEALAVLQSPDEELLSLLAAAPDTAVVPVCIDQSWRLLRHNLLPVPFGVTVRVWIGDPIPRRREEEPAALLATVEAAIRACLER